MGLNFKRWLLEKLGGDAQHVSSQEVTADDMFCALGEVYVREIAFWACANMVANAVSKCEFKTYRDSKEVKAREYYLWNYEPNKNQNSSAFIHKWLGKLYRNNEALVVEQGGQLLIADSYVRKPYALYDDQFTQVQVEDFVFDRTFYQADVLYFRLAENNMRKLTNGLYEQYQRLIGYAMKSYQRSRGSRGILNVSATAQGKTNFQETFAALMNQRFRDFYTADNAVLPLFDGFEYDDIGSKTYSNESTRDIKAMIDDVSDFTAKAFGIPPALLTGEVQGTSDALEQFLTFCVDPLCDMLQEEINRKRYGYSGFASGDGLKIDTKCIKHVDLLGVSTSIDKLISSGAFCINDIRALVGEQPIDDEWAKQHFMTKNYATVSELLNALDGKGGDDK